MNESSLSTFSITEDKMFVFLRTLGSHRMLIVIVTDEAIIVLDVS